ncbi:MAG: AAA family ATPase [Tissierellia bacterium]|nr:AAA family ATPase [Tissierellia bacterium]
MVRKIYLPNGMEAVEAEYKESPIAEYNNNPFIAALPELDDEETIIRKLMLNPIYSEEERELDASIKLHMIHRLYQFFQPLPKHIEIWNMINTLIRQGYLARNPFDKEYKRYINETGQEIINRSFDIDSRTNFRTTASSGLIIGFSGMGKTTTVNRVLSYIPQVIVHNYYNNQHFNQIQLTWLKLEAPHNSSLKALTLQFFMKIDELLGTENFKRYVSRNLSVDAMLPLMGKVAQNIGLGLLIIDELQHLSGSGARQIMNYFVTLINSFGVPIIFIGTPASYDFLQNEFRIARRVTGNGEVIWNNMKNDEEFELFLNGLWKFQWTRKNTPLTREIIDLFYEETQGISDLIVKLFVNAQYKAIVSGEEELTEEIILSVAKEEFKLMKPMLDAIKSKNPYKAIKYEDLRKIEEFNSNLSNTKSNDKANTKTTRNTNINKTKIARETLDRNNITRSTTQKVKIENLKEDDLRLLVDKGNKVGETTYETLLKNGLIDDLSFLEIGDIQ